MSTVSEIIAKAIYEEPGTSSRWEDLSQERKAGWIGDAVRVVAALQAMAGTEEIHPFLKSLVAKEELKRLGLSKMDTAMTLGHKVKAVADTIMAADREARLEQVLRNLMAAFERRTRSDCTAEQLELRPWRCAEFVAAEALLQQSDWIERAAQRECGATVSAGG